MSDFRQYQKYRLRKESAPGKIWRWAILIVILILIIWSLKSCLGKKNTNSNQNENLNANQNINININPSAANTNLNITNSNQNLNSNTNATATAERLPFSLATDCSKAISRGSSEYKEMTLTFDGGASTGGVAGVLQILKDKNVPADFFFTGKWVENNPEIIQTISDAGYKINNHSYDHPHVQDISAADLKTEITKTEDVVYNLLKKSTQPFFRPPYGEINDTIFKTAKEEGYCPILWTVDALDWETTQTADAAKQRVLDKASNGAIVLMHVGDDLVPQFLASLIDELKNRGYTFVTLANLLGSTRSSTSSE